jgi:phosphonate C-P lyase system protein PhnH
MQQTIDVDRQLVFYTQQTFRELLNGMARPGKIHQMRPFPLARGQFSQADYIFATARNRPDFLTDLRRGELERPDLGATVIMSVDYLSACQAKPDGAGLSLQLKGPGILNQNQIYLGGPQEEHWRLVAAANAEFPSGIDLILVCAGQFCCLPRTTTIEVGRER